MKKIIFMLMVVVKSVEVIAQQDPLYALYINNPLVINPGFTGINNNLMANLSYRTQWSAFDGNPTTMAASGQISLKDNKMGAGALLVSDRIGETTTTSASGMYAYKINFKDNVFSFGMQAGLINYKTDPGQLNLNPNALDDPSFAQVSETKFNLGAGAVLKSEKYLVGLSVPRLLGNTFETTGQSVQIYQQHFYLFGSYIYFLNDRILLKPSVLFKGVKGAPISTDLNFTIDINRTYAAGLFTRNFKAFGILAQFNFMEKYKLAYLYEIPTNKSVGTQFNTHEVMIGFRTSVFDFHDRSVSNF
jgi:type IX secretion system PorP/SprF family membrane protein